MNKKDLLEYLKAVCDAENAIYACDEAQSTLEAELKELEKTTVFSLPEKPTKPERRYSTYDVDNVNPGKTPAIIGGVIGLIISFICFAVDVEDPSPGLAFFVLLLPIIGAAAGYILTGGLRAWNEKQETSQAQVNYDNDYERDMEKYQRDVKKYEKKLEIREQLIQEDKRIRNNLADELRIMLGENSGVRKRVSAVLEKLYGKGIIYDSFRNMAAVNTMYEYVAMGLCEELEGPHGAYAQYMEDLRTNKICGSIEDLKISLVNVMKEMISVQRQLVNEVKMVNSNLRGIHSTISSGFDSLVKEISNGYNTTLKSLDSLRGSVDSASCELSAIRAQEAEMTKYIHASAHNQYIELREKNINNYLLKNPNFL